MRARVRRARGGRGRLYRGDPGRLRATGLTLFLRSSIGITIATGISQWSDQSGSGNHLAQATGSAQPTLVSSVYNGRPCARFVSANSQVLSKTNVDIIGTGPYAFACLLKINSSAGADAMFGNTNTGAGATLFTDTGPVNCVLHAGVVAYDGSAIQTASPALWIANRAVGSKPDLRINGASQSLSGAPTGLNAPGGTGLLAIGAQFSTTVTNFSNIDVTEAFAMSRALSASELARVEPAIRARYAA